MAAALTVASLPGVLKAMREWRHRLGAPLGRTVRPSTPLRRGHARWCCWASDSSAPLKTQGGNVCANLAEVHQADKTQLWKL